MTIDVYTDSDDVIIDVGTDTRETPEVVTDSLYGPKGEKGDKGDTGATGADGQDGEDGFSPIATVSKSGSVATITITDKYGTTTAEVYDGSGTGLVNSVNGETGDVVLTASDVGALPDTTTIPTKTSDLTNDSGFITSSELTGYATETWVNNKGYITGVTSTDVTNALGYTPYNSTNPNGYITGITSSDVTTALGYTPYDSSNPDGYTTNIGTVTSVNNTSPDSNGNVTLSIPAAQVNSDWNAASGVAQILNKPTIPSDTSDLTNGAGYITSSALTPYELIDKTVNVLSTSGTITLTDNSINSITPSGNITFTLPTIADNTVFHEIMVQINLSTVYTIDVGTTYYFNKTAPDLSTAGTYNLYYEYDKASQQWCCGALSKGTAS